MPAVLDVIAFCTPSSSLMLPIKFAVFVEESYHRLVKCELEGCGTSMKHTKNQGCSLFSIAGDGFYLH